MVTCIKMGSDESHFNVSLIVRDKVTKTVSTNHNLFEEKGEPKRYRTEVLPFTSLTGLTARPNRPSRAQTDVQYNSVGSGEHKKGAWEGERRQERGPQQWKRYLAGCSTESGLLFAL